LKNKFASTWTELETAIPANSPQAIAFATLCIALATLIRWTLEGSITLLFPTYYPAILLVSLVCGLPVTLYAIALSIIAAWWFFMAPAYNVEWSTNQALNIGLYTLATTLIAWIGNSRRKLNEKTRLLTRELQHRGKNQLMLVQAILLQTMRRDASMEKALGRIANLAITDDLLSKFKGHAVPLHELAASGLKSFAERVSIQGPPYDLGSDLATVTILVLHEFATNAAKYGALSNAEGRVTLTWAIDKDLRITWRETGGPRVTEPEAAGEGLELVQRLIAGAGGQLSSGFAPTGVSHQVLLPNPSRKSLVAKS
jgi:two-component sensor histidine kinase